jgi:hypothetical protein
MNSSAVSTRIGSRRVRAESEAPDSAAGSAPSLSARSRREPIALNRGVTHHFPLSYHSDETAGEGTGGTQRDFYPHAPREALRSSFCQLEFGRSSYPLIPQSKDQ